MHSKARNLAASLGYTWDDEGLLQCGVQYTLLFHRLTGINYPLCAAYGLKQDERTLKGDSMEKVLERKSFDVENPQTFVEEAQANGELTHFFEKGIIIPDVNIPIETHFATKKKVDPLLKPYSNVYSDELNGPNFLQETRVGPVSELSQNEKFPHKPHVKFGEEKRKDEEHRNNRTFQYSTIDDHPMQINNSNDSKNNNKNTHKQSSNRNNNQNKNDNTNSNRNVNTSRRRRRVKKLIANNDNNDKDTRMRRQGDSGISIDTENDADDDNDDNDDDETNEQVQNEFSLPGFMSNFNSMLHEQYRTLYNTRATSKCGTTEFLNLKLGDPLIVFLKEEGVFDSWKNHLSKLNLQYGTHSDSIVAGEHECKNDAYYMRWRDTIKNATQQSTFISTYEKCFNLNQKDMMDICIEEFKNKEDSLPKNNEQKANDIDMTNNEQCIKD